LDKRETEIRSFLKVAKWGKADRASVPGDASSRRYERLSLGHKKAVLMDSPKGAETPSEPDGASVQDRKSKPLPLSVMSSQSAAFQPRKF